MIGGHSNHHISQCQWLVLGLWLSAVAGAAEPAVFDRAVASVDGRVVTQSQLDFETRVLLINAGGAEAATAPLGMDDLKKGLELVIDQRVTTLEADKLDAYQLEAGEVEKLVARFRDGIGGEAQLRRFLDDHEAELNDVAQVLRRSLRSSRVLDGRLRLKAQVTEADARRHQAEHAELKGLTVQQVRELLFANRFKEMVRQELKAARKSVDVRLLGPFASQPGASP